MLSRLAAAALVVCFAHAGSGVLAEATLQAKAWQAAGASPTPSDFPENSDPSVASRPSTAIAFSGGGSRSYLASVGYLSALHELGLIDQVRYITGISGGSWVTLNYVYSQSGVEDTVLLGPILEPEEITQEKLNVMDTGCMRKVTDSDYTKIMIELMRDGAGGGEAWVGAYQQVYLDPMNIPAKRLVSWSEETVNDIINRNPSLRSADFVIPTGRRPFPIVGTTLVGPEEGEPYSYDDNRNLTMLELSAMYVGTMNKKYVDYHYHKGAVHTVTVGGAVEPFAFSLSDAGAVPPAGLGDEPSGTLRVPSFEHPMDIAHMGGSSSYAVGLFVDTLPSGLSDDLSLRMKYWSSVDDVPTAKDTLFSDGGTYENVLLSSLLQRRVEKVVLFYNSHLPLQSSSSWNVYEDEYTGDQVTDDLAAYFGVFVADYAHWAERGYDYRRNQVWDSSEWGPLITKMQDAQMKGKGIIVSANLTTVKNDWWGIPAGIQTEVTFVYLSRCFEWESRLSEEMKELLVPRKESDAADPAETIGHGDFKDFPHYATAGANINYEKANALASLTGWTVKQNSDIFRRIFS